MAKDGGRRAARFILEKHPELFTDNLIEAHPPIKAYMPKVKVTSKAASLELLANYIEGCNVQDSIEVYKMLEEKGEKVPVKAMQRLLEITAYYNEGEEMQEDFNLTAGLLDQKVNWSAGGLAEKLCQGICEAEGVTEEDRMKAKAVLMCGLSKHKQFSKAKKIFEELKPKLPDSRQVFKHHSRPA